MRLFIVTAALAASAFAAAPAPTFHRDVLPILQKRCQECHRAGEAAPMALMTYEQARPWAKSIRQAVVSKRMPPWHADPHFGKFANDRALSQGEIDTLAAWADSGAKEGKAKDAPAPLAFTPGWTIGQPDLVLEMPVSHTIPAKGTVDYTYFVVPTGFTEDKWIEKIELRPGAREVVHHIVLFARPEGSKFMKDVAPGVAHVPEKHAEDKSKPRKPQSDRGEFIGLGDGSGEMISVYVPGGAAYTTRPGQARLIKAGSDLIFQMHYTANGKEAVDRSKVGIVFAKSAPKERVVNTFIANLGLIIPPGAAGHRVDARVILNQDATLQSFFPHMHARGKAFEYTVKLPGSTETQTLIRVPRYDFNWQHTYQMQEPMRLPKGTEITATAWYDNSANNKSNPDPKSTVYWGDQTWEEMLAGFVDLAIPADMNPATLKVAAKKAAPAPTETAAAR
jgi:hypothetical protein